MITVNDQGVTLSSAFNNALTATVQKVKPKVTAEWRNSKVLSNVSASVSPDYSDSQKLEGEVGDFFDVRQLMNGWNRQAATWAVAGDLDVNGLGARADGTWHAMPEKNTGVHEFGWRASTKSNSSGVYTATPVVTVDFDQEKINYIEIYTSEYSGAIKEYTLQYKDSSDNYQNVVANHVLAKGTSTYKHTLSGGNPIDVKGVKLTIIKTHNGNDHARVHEINPIYETDISDYIISMFTEKNREIHDTTLPLGGIAANSFKMSLDNSGHDFTIGNSKLYGEYMSKDVKLTIALGWRTSTDPDVYEYINCGTYWVDEWKQSSNMTVDVQARDYTRFLTDALTEGGFIATDCDAATALRQLLTQGNFPRADFQALYPYQTMVREDGAIAHYRFNEGTSSGDLSAGSSSITPSSGLLARWWILGDLSGDTSALHRALFMDDRTTQSGILGFGGKELIDYNKSPSVIENSTTNSASGYAVNHTDRNPGSQADFYHTVIDGFIIPPSTGTYTFKVTVENGGFRLYMGGAASRSVFESSSEEENARRDLDSFKGELVLDKFFNNQSSIAHETAGISLEQNKPVPIRIEAFHVIGDFNLKVERKIGAGAYAALSPAETTTDIAFDVLGGRDDYVAANNYSSLTRNHGIYSGDPILRKAGGIMGEPKDFSVGFSTSGSNDFMTIPYEESLDLTDSSSENYTGRFSIEALVKFTSHLTGEGAYAGNMDNAHAAYGTKGVGFIHTSAAHGVKLFDTTGAQVTAYESSAGINNVWRHVVGTYDGTYLKYYVNGELIDTKAFSGSPALWENQDFLIGKSVDSSPADNKYMNGDMSEFAIYREALTAEQVRDHYYSTVMAEIRIHPYLFGEKNAFEIAGNIATGDLGMFYFDEFGKFRYDHFNRLHESDIPDHSTSQAAISDSTNIKSAERRIELLANKITINVNPTIAKNVGVSSLWRPPSPTTLTVTKIASGSGINDTIITQINADNTSNPPWPKSGYIKIENEIIKYDAMEGNYFKTLTRAQFGTTAASHAAEKKIREVRHFEFEWSKSPAVEIKAPYIAAIEFESPDLVSIDKFVKKPYGGEIVLSATDNVSIDSNIGQIVYIEGTNPYTGLLYYASIAGRAISDGGSTSKITSQSSSYSESIRKYGLKEVKIDNRFISDDDYAKRLADFLIDKMQNGVPIIEVSTISMPKLQLGDRITVSRIEQLGISNKDYWVMESKIDYTGGVAQRLTLREAV